MARSHRRARPRRALLAGVVCVLTLLGLVAHLPGAHARFSAGTVNAGDAWAADRLAAPTALVATQTCSTTPAIAFRAAATATGGTSLVFSPPAGTQAGDVLVAQVAYRYGPTTVTAPSGWTRVLTDTSSGEVSSAIYVKVATGSEPTATFSRPSGSSGDMVGGVSAYSGVDTGNPIAAAAGAIGAGATATTPALSTTATDTRLVHFFTKRQEDLPAPTEPTPRWRLMSGTGTATQGITAGDESLGGPGTTPARSATSTANFPSQWVAQSVALRRPAGTPSAALSWTASPSSWATGYRLERSAAGTVQNARSLSPIGTTAATEGPLTNGVTHTFRLWAHHRAWTSSVVSTTLTPAC